MMPNTERAFHEDPLQWYEPRVSTSLADLIAQRVA